MTEFILVSHGELYAVKDEHGRLITKKQTRNLQYLFLLCIV